MSNMIGFSQEEWDDTIRIINECAEAYKTGDISGVLAVQHAYELQEVHNNALSKEEAPTHYRCFWNLIHKLYEGKTFVQFSFIHTRRQSPHSPDGRECITSTWVLLIEAGEDHKIFRRVT